MHTLRPANDLLFFVLGCARSAAANACDDKGDSSNEEEEDDCGSQPQATNKLSICGVRNLELRLEKLDDGFVVGLPHRNTHQQIHGTQSTVPGRLRVLHPPQIPESLVFLSQHTTIHTHTNAALTPSPQTPNTSEGSAETVGMKPGLTVAPVSFDTKADRLA